MRKKHSSGLVFSEEQLSSLGKKGGSGKDWDAPEKNKAPAKRRGKDEKPILAALATCIPECTFGEGYVTMVFPGVKLFTLNDIYAIKEFRSYVDMQYKKAWHALIKRAVTLGGKDRFPSFSNGCEITVFRQAPRKVDRDALAIMFKYAIDGLRYAGVIDEDDTDIVRDIPPYQRIGEELAVIRIDACSQPEIETDVKTLVESSTSVWRKTA